MERQAALGKPVGLGITTYSTQNATPSWLFDQDLSTMIDCGNGWILPKYWHPLYLEKYGNFIRALAARYDGDPRIAWVEMGHGIYGETAPGRDTEKSCVEQAGLTSSLWVQTVNQITESYYRAFRHTQLLIQFAPSFKGGDERRQITEYAAARGIGLKHNGLTADNEFAIVGDGNGPFEPMLKWWPYVPIGWETYASQPGMLTGDKETMWGIYNGLSKHPDYLIFEDKIVTDPVRLPMLLFARDHLGVTITNTPSVWVALRETKWPTTSYPQRGSYEFWLYHNNDVIGGRTVPTWTVGTAPEGWYTLRTDQTSGNSYMYFNVDDAYLYRNQRPVTITVTYYDTYTDTWELQYQAGDNLFKSAGVITKTNSGNWLRATFVLTDALLANGQPGGGRFAGSDFRLSCRNDGDDFFHLVQVVKSPADTALTEVNLTLRQGVNEYTGTTDTYLSAWSPTTNFGSSPLLSVRPVNVMHTLLQFDLSQIPPQATINRATLSLLAISRTNTAGVSILAYPLNRWWQDSSATWNLAATGIAWGTPGASAVPTDRASLPIGSQTLLSAPAWYTFELTAPVQEWVLNPGSNHGLILVAPNPGSAVEYAFASSEHPDVAARPYLSVNYYLPPPSPSPTPTGTPPTATPSSTPLPPTPTRTPTPSLPVRRLVLRNGVDGYTGNSDVYISNYFPNSNFGDSEFLSIRTANIASILTRFDLTSIPPGSQVLQATYYVLALSSSNPAGLAAITHGLLRPWSMSEATWNQALTGVAWGQAGASLAGVDRSAVPRDSIVMTKVNNWYSLDLTTIAQQWVNAPQSNYGLILRAPGTTNAVQYNLASSRHANLEARPFLVVEYLLPGTPTPPGPTATPTKTSTSTPTQTGTPPTPTSTATPSPSGTPTPTRTVTSTPTRTLTPTVTPTPTITPTPGPPTPTPQTTPVFLEAEAGAITAPMIRASDSHASGCSYVYSAQANAGTVALAFYITTPGVYAIYGRAWANANAWGANSFWFSVDGGGNEGWWEFPASGSWEWDALSSDGQVASPPVTYTLSAGPHILTFRGREANARLDAIFISGDGSLPPSVPPCTTSPTVTSTPLATPTWAATPTPTRTTSATPTPSATATRTATVTSTLTPTRSPTPTSTGSTTPTASPTGTATPASTHTGTATSVPSRTPSATPTPSATSTAVPSHTPTPTPTNTAVPSHTPTPTPTTTTVPSHTPTPTTSPTPTTTPYVGVILYVQPPMVTVSTNEVFSVTIRVAAGEQPIDAVEVHLNFDPDALQVTDAAGQPATSLLPGLFLPLVLANQANNSLGQIDFAAGLLDGSSPSGDFVLFTVYFKALSPRSLTTLNFVRDGVRYSAIVSQGSPITSQMIDGRVQILGGAILQGNVQRQGRPASPHPSWAQPIQVTLYAAGRATPVYDLAITTDESGNWVIGDLEPGVYDLYVKGSQTLRRHAPNLVLNVGLNPVVIGLLPEGDANGDNCINIVDFSILRLSFGLMRGQTGFDPRADFNNDNLVTIQDFSLMSSNFGDCGAFLP